MCVIILRQPKVDIPFEKIKSACVVNPDGWGIAVADRGKLHVYHGLADKEKGTDPEMIASLLEDAKNQHILLHLRYVTAGERSLVNCHPFKVLSHDEDGNDVYFAHNGTLWSYKETGSTYSDSYHFVNKFVRPLYQRAAKYQDPSKVLEDDFCAELLEEKAGANSLFSLIDGNGEMLAINYSDGKQFEGWWASNEYSFNEVHRKSTNQTHFVWDTDDWDTKTYGGSAYGSEWQSGLTQDNKTIKTELSTNISNSTVVAKAFEAAQAAIEDAVDEIEQKEAENLEEVLEQGQEIGEKLSAMKTQRLNPSLVNKLLDKKHIPFTTLCKIDNLMEVTRFDPDDIAELIAFYPEAATVLIQDLLFELYIKNRQTKIQEAKDAKTQQAA